MNAILRKRPTGFSRWAWVLFCRFALAAMVAEVMILLGLVRRLNDEGFQDHIVVEAVQVQAAGDLQVHARLDPIHNGGGLLGRHELVHPDGGGVVGNIKGNDPGITQSGH